jgi:hypothetical protein
MARRLLGWEEDEDANRQHCYSTQIKIRNLQFRDIFPVINCHDKLLQLGDGVGKEKLAGEMAMSP